jgi:ABC-2 type transport system ATP-binding protein
VVLQETQHDHYLTLGETVDLVRGWYPDPLPAAEVLEAVSLDNLVRQRVATLSGGQLRRLDVALGIVGRPEVLFLDEPTTGFDPDARRQTWDVVRGLRDRGTTVLLTTHYLDEAEALADRVVVLHGGRVVADEPPAKLGQRDQMHLVSFVPSATAAALPFGGVVTAGRWAVETDDVTHVVRELSRWAECHDQRLDDLVIGRRSLEDAYLQLIG